jgi:hypothetical protein
MTALSAGRLDRFRGHSLRRLDKIGAVGWLYIALLALAVIVVIAAEWPRLEKRFGLESRRSRERARRKASLKLLRNESDDFAASVERDLANLPTTNDRR